MNILLGRYDKLDRTDEGIYLKAFTGDRCKVDRQSRESVLFESPCLSALWLTQPDKLDSLLGERSLSDGGLIPRILACHTNCEAREIIKDAPEILPAIEKAYSDLIRCLIETYRLADEPFTIEPAPEALEAMNAHYNAIVKRRRADLRDVTIYAARWNEQAWRIAVCLHAAQHGAHAHEHGLELDTANRAIDSQTGLPRSSSKFFSQAEIRYGANFRMKCFRCSQRSRKASGRAMFTERALSAMRTKRTRFFLRWSRKAN